MTNMPMRDSGGDSPGPFSGAYHDTDSPPAGRIGMRQWSILIFLTAVYACNWMDRYVILILLDPVRMALAISDGVMGSINGFLFSLLYSLSGLLIGRFAAGSKKKITFAIVVLGWSLATALTGTVTTVGMFVCARMLVACFEAGCGPLAYATISEVFHRQWRSRAISIYSSGLYIGMWLGLLLGGVISQYFGWRSAFMAVSLPGLLLGVASFWVLPRTAQGANTARQAELTAAEPSADGWRAVASKDRILFGCAALALGFLTAATGAFENWIPTWLERAKGLSAASAGELSGFIDGGGGFVCSLLIGVVVDRLICRSRRWFFLLPLLGSVGFGLAIALFFFVPALNLEVAYMLCVIGATSYLVPLMALGQDLLPARRRAEGAAMMLLVMNIVGMGGGTFLTGLLSDGLKARGAADPLGMAILLMQGALGIGIVLLLCGFLLMSRDRPAVSAPA